METWKSTIGRVSFINCDPLFHGLGNEWNILSAPPSWLTGHLLRNDCLMAPIPAADFADNCDELMLIPDIGISSRGEVGSVLLFGDRKIEDMRDVAIPSDSSTSVRLLEYLLKVRGCDPRLVLMGPDLDTMLDRCDGALLIGDRALSAAREHPERVRMDLGTSWMEHTGNTMVFGVFAARKDTPLDTLKLAHSALVERLDQFENDLSVRNEVIESSAEKTGQSQERIQRYFGEVINRLESDDLEGLERFLESVCGMKSAPSRAW